MRAVGKLSEALESVERARGHLYSWHQLTGKGDFELGDASALLAEAGHQDLADELSRELVGRNVLTDRWSFQAVEEYEDTYYEPLRRYVSRVRELLTAGERHLYEAELKEERRTHGHPNHTAAPSPDSAGRRTALRRAGDEEERPGVLNGEDGSSVHRGGAKYSPDGVVWVVMTHLADEGVKDAFTVPDVDPMKARQAAADLLRALGVAPTEPQDPW